MDRKVVEMPRSQRTEVTIWYYDGDRLSERCDEGSLAGVFEGG